MYFTNISEIEVATEQLPPMFFKKLLITLSLTLVLVSTTPSLVSCRIDN